MRARAPASHTHAGSGSEPSVDHALQVEPLAGQAPVELLEADRLSSRTAKTNTAQPWWLVLEQRRPTQARSVLVGLVTRARVAFAPQQADHLVDAALAEHGRRLGVA